GSNHLPDLFRHVSDRRYDAYSVSFLFLCTPGKYTDLSQRQNSAHHDSHMFVPADNPHLEFPDLSFSGHQTSQLLSSNSDMVQGNRTYQSRRMYCLSDC